MARKSTAKLCQASMGTSCKCAKAIPSRPAARPCVRGRALRSCSAVRGSKEGAGGRGTPVSGGAK
eukprot:11532598-Alexandrium_andersonii.AAC.1